MQKVPREPVGRLIDEAVRYKNKPNRPQDLHVPYMGTHKPMGSPRMSPRLPPRSGASSPTPIPRASTPIPAHSSTPPPGSDSGPSSRRPSTLMPPDVDSRRGSLTKQALMGVMEDARKGVKQMADSSVEAGRKVTGSTKTAGQQVSDKVAATAKKVTGSTKSAGQQVSHKVAATAKKVKDKTVVVSGQMKDASQWVASQTSKTAKAAMEQAKSSLSCGEKFMLFASEKISILSQRGFTHIFLFLIFAGYTALGGILFVIVEGSAEKERINSRLPLETFIERLLKNVSVQLIEFKQELSKTTWDKILVPQLLEYEQYIQDAHDDKPVWTFVQAMFFCSTITTTIGYGHIYPSTNAGRALTIVYAIMGIPIFLILLADFGKLFTRLLKNLFVFMKKMYRTATCRRIRKTRAVQYTKAGIRATGGWCSSLCRRIFCRCCGRKGKEATEEEEAKKKEAEEVKGQEDEEDVVDDNFNLPISLALLILLIYMLVGGALYPWEEWPYFNAVYFIFISMTTIGFGDMVPEHPAFMMLTTIYMLFGLSLTAMSINIIQEKLSDTFKHASEKLKETMRTMVEAASQGEEAGLPEGKEVEVAEVHGANKNTPKVEVKKET